jgi:glucose-1-phosphate cytidylyltransferase
VKAVILAGGRGSRLSEETHLRPKPMVEVGGRPILWHIMKLYSAHGIDEFIVCLGYKGYVIKEWFANYALHTSDVTMDLGRGTMEVHRSTTEPWRVTLVDTGEATQTGGRLARVLPFAGDEPFCFTYGDGLADLDIGALVDFHRDQGALATVTAVQPAGRYGAMDVDAGAARVRAFREKPRDGRAWINGGFFVLEPAIARYLAGDATVWEAEPLERLAADGELAAFAHDGFWMAMDTVRDRDVMEGLWRAGDAPWKRW